MDLIIARTNGTRRALSMGFKWDYTVFKEVIIQRKTRPVKSELLRKLRREEYRIVMVEKLDSWANGSTELILSQKISKLLYMTLFYKIFPDGMKTVNEFYMTTDSLNTMETPDGTVIIFPFTRWCFFSSLKKNNSPSAT